MPQLQELWDEGGQAFAQRRTAQRAARLGLCQLAGVGRHTLTSLLATGGRQFVDWSGDYRLFSRDRWETRELFRPVVGGVLDLLPEGAPFRAALDDAVPWQEVTAFAAGKPHPFRVKTIAPVLWKKAGAQCPLRLVVIAPLGYRLRQGSKVLYRQPAFLICTNPDLPLDPIVQDYVWRWEIEVNHRDEKQIIGVGQAQVWSAQSVDRQPGFAVASYALVLLAAERTARSPTGAGSLAPPKWQGRSAPPRRSTQELIRQLRSEVWSYAIERLSGNSDPFVTEAPSVTKCPESQLPVVSALLYSAAG